MTTKYVQALTQYLAGSGVIVGATTITLQSLTDIYGNNVTSMSSFGSKGYITLEPDTSNEEAATFTTLTVNANGTVTLGGISTVLAQTPYTETSGLVRAHVGGSKVVITDNVAFWNSFPNKANDETITGQWTFNVFPITPSNSPASTTVLGVIKTSVAPADPLNPIAVGPNDTTVFAPVALYAPGMITQYAGRTAPTGWLFCDGSAVSRTTYASLFAAIAPSGTFTVTIASPGVFTKTAHGFVAGDKIHLTTTGALPTGLATNTDYYVLSTGLTANTFQVALSPEGTAVNTSGSQSGTHTLYASAWGKGDGSTTFNLPDLRNRAPIGIAASAPTTTLSFEPAAVNTGTDTVTIPNYVFPAQGQKVQVASTGTLPTGLSAATDYYIIRASSTTIKFATSQANANAGTAIDLTGAGTGVITMTYTNSTQTVLGRTGGEENHGISQGEHAAHTHSLPSVTQNGGSGVSAGTGSNVFSAATVTGSQGSDSQHNNMQPFAVVNYIIKT